MQLLLTIVVCLFAGAGAGLGTGFAGMSAAAVITPIRFMRKPKYDLYESPCTK